MKKYGCMLLFVIGTCMLSCGSEKQNGGETKEEEQEQVKREENDSEALSGELTILSATSIDFWRPIIEEFENIHPDVTIHVDMPSEEEEKQFDVFMEKFVTKAISGKNYDLIDACYLSMDKYGAQQGLFVDLNEMMEADESFHREDYFSCIFEPMEIDGKLYGMSGRVAPLYCRLNQELLDAAGLTYEGETISFQDLYTLYQDMQDHVKEPVYFAYAGWFDPMGGYETGYFVRNQLFDSEEYIEYLQMNTELKFPSEAREYWNEEMWYLEGLKGEAPDESFVRVVRSYALQSAFTWDDLFEDTEEFTRAFLYEGMHGEHYISSNTTTAINSMSQNKELAWEFLKFSISDHDFGKYDYGTIPVNKSKAERLAKELSEEERERLFADMEILDTVPFCDGRLGLMLDSIKQDFYIHQTITAEECAQKMAERAEIYMKE